MNEIHVLAITSLIEISLYCSEVWHFVVYYQLWKILFVCVTIILFINNLSFLDPPPTDVHTVIQYI